MSLDRQKVIDTAQKYAAKGQFDKAIVEYMRIVREDPSDVRILLKIGDLQVRKGSKDDAIATYSRVAKSYDDQGFFLKAIAVYKQILSIDPNLTELYTKLADLYVKLGLLPDALSNLDALASRFARAGQDDRLVGVYRQMVEVDKTNIPSRIKLAELLSKLSKPDEAAAEFEAGCELLKDAGRHEDWAKVAERLLYHRPNDLVVARQLAQHYVDRQDAKRALPKLQVCFKANPRDVETLELLASAFRELGQIPKTIWVLKEVARIHTDAGRVEQKLDTFKRILELSPNDAEAKEGLRGSSRLAKRPSGTHPSAQAPARRPSSASMPAATAVPTATASSAAEPGPALESDSAEPDEVVLVDEESVESIPPPAERPATSPSAPIAKIALAKAPAVPSDTGPVVPLERRVDGRLSREPSRPNVPAASRQSLPSASVPAPVVVSSTPPAASGIADVGRMIAEADIFLKYGLKQKALAHVVKALEIDPANLDVLVRLRDLSADGGDAATSVEASVRIAELLAESDPAAAMAEVTRALEWDPDNAYAADLYQRLGGAYQPAAEEEYAPEVEQPAEDAAAFPEVQTYTEEAYAQADDPALAQAQEYAADGYEEAGDYAQQTSPDGYAAEVPAAIDAGAGGGAGGDIEEGLDEAEFFVTQGLYDEARESLQTLFATHPGHPLIVERLEELEALVAAQAAPGEDQSFALAERLAEEMQAVPQDAHFASGGEMIDVDTVFEQFKKGIEKTVSADDAETHYDLGIAYKEMGLIEDAISEFRIASQSTRKACLAETMMGLCHSERGDVASAIDHFKRALQVPTKTDREELGLYFELGNAYEAAGDLSEAMYFFQKVEKREPGFRNVKARVQRLAAHVQSGTRAQPAVSPEMDDVDRAFDELLKG